MLVRQLYGGKVITVARFETLDFHAEGAVEERFGPELRCSSTAQAPRAKIISSSVEMEPG